ncbi:unnamed protein product [Phytophthora fragariaefolia]|uniref:Unnamed protein product n=1 Tax=Phytophthora fragariaefolia TaxID=1490495 RepID=A0A9W7CKI0_9STRA|nr:unnamed protein product [Phytophthora fragariaefolia]
MYTQLMVTVAIPQDGKFVFAGVYRGSTDIRAFEVDSIALPAPADLPQSAARARADSDDSDDSDDDVAAFGVPTAKVTAHTFSDAKLKGFAAAKSVRLAGSGKTEYRLLCGIGIKNVHMWRFYQKGLEWSWECVFDKQTNGISLEFITFHPTAADQFISKSEHQNVRIWHLEEDYDAASGAVTIRKKSHTDVKQTTDTVAVYGDYAYGGGESLAVVDLQSASRMDLDLPLSAKEQRAQREAALTSRNASSLRAWNPRGSRRRGAEDTSAQRHMRTVTKVAGQDASPFTVGMCSDGSVFFHQPKEETGIATPLDYIEGYEQFFVDPSLDFQAQFSDLTRVNTSGLVAVLPLPETEREKWMVVAANQEQILVRSLEAFLYRNEQKKEYSQVKSDLRNVMRDLGGAESSSDESDNSSDSDVEGRKALMEKLQRSKKHEKTSQKRTRQDSPSKPQESGRKVKRSRHESDKASSHSKASTESAEKRKGSSKNGLQKKFQKSKQLSADTDQVKASSPCAVNDLASVTTPKRGTSSVVRNGSASTASPVVSISSSSESSNPNTPEQPGLSRVERQLLALKELQWTPPSAAASKARTNNQEELTDSAVDAAAVLAQLSSSSNQAERNSKNASSGKKTTHRLKAQALFTDDAVEDKNNEKEVAKEVEVVSSSTKKPTDKASKRGRAGSKKSVSMDSSKPEKRVLEDNQVESAKSGEEMDADDELDDELEQLEQFEPEFVSVPLASDNGSLLAASTYQYASAAVSSCSDDIPTTDADIEADHAAASSEQANLLMQFSQQNERLKMNFLAERERIYKHPDCSCASHSQSKKSSSSSSGGVNWRRNVAHDYLKRKQLKRRHKKALAAKLQQLHASYAVQIQELLAMQQMQANALRARQQFQHLHLQLRRQAAKLNCAPPSPSTVASPIKYTSLPDHLSGSNFPYPELLS